jgi:lipid II:glycine glycyltransferase (peptidoglycan interpeptide bridge formation enzyme)
MEGQEKEIGQLRKQIKHLEEKERLANDNVILSSFLLCCFTTSLNKVGTMRQAHNTCMMHS